MVQSEFDYQGFEKPYPAAGVYRMYNTKVIIYVGAQIKNGQLF